MRYSLRTSFLKEESFLTSLARTERATQLSQEVYLRAQSRVQREILFFSTQAVHFISAANVTASKRA